MNRNPITKAIRQDDTSIIVAQENSQWKKLARKILAGVHLRTYRPDEIPVKELYVVIFNELFVTGKYDHLFEESGIDEKISSFIQI